MPKLVPVKPKKLIKILMKLGFHQRDAEGSHVFSNIMMAEQLFFQSTIEISVKDC